MTKNLKNQFHTGSDKFNYGFLQLEFDFAQGFFYTVSNKFSPTILRLNAVNRYVLDDDQSEKNRPYYSYFW